MRYIAYGEFERKEVLNCSCQDWEADQQNNKLNEWLVDQVAINTFDFKETITESTSNMW